MVCNKVNYYFDWKSASLSLPFLFYLLPLYNSGSQGMASPLNHMALLLLSLSWPISLLSSPYPDQLNLLARNQGHQSDDLLPFQRPQHQLVVLPASLLSFWLFLYSVHPHLNSFQHLRLHSLSPVLCFCTLTFICTLFHLFLHIPPWQTRRGSWTWLCRVYMTYIN